MQILYTEDNGADADLTLMHFQEAAPEFRFELAGTAEECMAKLSRTQFDLLLLDQGLPDMQGLEVLARVRRLEDAPPVVMLTGSGNEDHVIKALRLGAVDYIRKHGDYLEKMPGLLRQVIERDQSFKRSGLAPCRTHCKLLYVESSTMDLDLTMQYFSQDAPNFQIHSLRTAEEALGLLKIKEHDFQAVITDLRLPDISGLELLRLARQSGVTLPFIIVTGKGDEEKAVAALKLGAYDYIVKRDNYLMQVVSSVENAILRHLAEHRTMQLQKELQQSNQALAQANHDLDAFTRSVAHELRGPLRSMLSFAQIIREDLAETLSPDQLAPLDRIASNAQKMTNLMEALLSFAKFSRQEVKRQRIDLTELVAEAWKTLEDQTVRRKIDFKVHPLPAVYADPVLLRQVMINLLSNAVKFTRDKPSALIEIGTVSDAPEMTIYIRDNGAGFSPEHATRLFQPFERLHSSEQFEGTGIGLALVQRIIERHNGRICAEGKKGEGAAFYFTLGKS